MELTTTGIAKMIDPKIMADMVHGKLSAALRFAPLAKVDYSFVGRPGDKIVLPKYTYIGDATAVGEGAAIPIAALGTSSMEVPVQKAGKGVKLTDEAVLSGYGDPMGETTAQLAMSIAAKVDGDCMAALNGITADMTYDAASTISSAVIADALVKFGENPDGDKVLFIAPAQLAQIRKDINFVSKGDMATDIMMKGTVGELWGCQLVVSNKIKVTGTKFTNYIVKPEALAIYLKRDVELETARDIECKLTVITADQHYAVYLMDESKAIKLTVLEK